MVLNSKVVVQVAYISADVFQYISCIPQRLTTHQLLHLLFVYPFQQFHRFTLCLWTFFCLPPSEPYVFFYPSTSSSSSSSSSSSTFDDDFLNYVHIHIE